MKLTKSGLTRLLTLLVVGFTTIQGVIPQMPLKNESSRIIISAIIMFIVVSLTAWKQFASVEIRNGAIWPTLIIAVVAILGGANDLVNAIPINADTGQWIRLGLTSAAMILTISSKSLWPTPESHEIESVKKELVAAKKEPTDTPIE